MDCYNKNSIKDSTRQKRGVKKCLQGDKWHSLLTVNENKTDLIHCFAEYLKVKSLAYFDLNIPITITEGENTIRIDQTGWNYLDICNHEEADSRIPLHVAASNTDCMIVSKDTDVFFVVNLRILQMQISKNLVYEIR